MTRLLLIATCTLLLTGCSSDDAVSPAGDSKPAAAESFTHKPQGPVTIDYRIIGAPIVGQPLAVNVEVQSLLGPQQIVLSYRINDSTALEFAASQPAQLSIAPSNDDRPSVQQVSLVPLREGRVFLNVAASVDVDGRTLSTAIAIPIQVGSAPRQVDSNGTVGADATGQAIHSLPAAES